MSQVCERLGCDSEAGRLQADWTPAPAGPRKENNSYSQSQTVIPKYTSSQETGSVMNDPKRPQEGSVGTGPRIKRMSLVPRGKEDAVKHTEDVNSQAREML